MIRDKNKAKLYQQALLQHHKAPTGFNLAINVSHQAHGSNAACGDEIELQLEYAGGQIRAVAFSGESCAICRASASILCRQLPGSTAAQASEKITQIEEGLEGRRAFPQDAEALIAVSQYPVRKQCAWLPWSALKEIMPRLANKNNTENSQEKN